MLIFNIIGGFGHADQIDSTYYENDKTPVIFGFDLYTITETDIKDTKAAIQYCMKELGKNIQVKVESRVYDNYKTIISDLKSGNLDVGNVSPIHYLHINSEVETDLAYGESTAGSKFRRYLLVTHADSMIDNIDMLENKSIAAMKTNEMGLLYLNNLLLEHGKKESGQYFSSIVDKRLFSQAIFAVFFGQVDACLTTEAAFNAAVELNPQLGRKLKIIAVSPELLSMVAFFRNDFPDDYRERTWEVVYHLDDTEYGRQVLMLFHIDGLVPITKDDLKSLVDMIDEYKKLGGKDANFHIDCKKLR